MKQIKTLALALSLVGGLIASTAPAQASVIWGNSASGGFVNLEAFDSVTGLLIPGQQFLVPNLTARADNGRGVALLGNTIYYTTANSGNIYVTNAVTHTDDGILVNTGFAGIANVATDGTLIYASDYQGATGIVFVDDSARNLVVGCIDEGAVGRDVGNPWKPRVHQNAQVGMRHGVGDIDVA